MYVRGGLKELSSTSACNLVHSLMNIFDCQFEKFNHPKKFAAYVTKDVFTWNDGTCIFFVLIWSIGVTGDTKSRVKIRYLPTKNCDCRLQW